MTNFEWLLTEHPRFEKLPKLPYVVGKDKIAVLTFSEEALQTSDSTITDKLNENLSIIYDYYFYIHDKQENAQDEVNAFRFVVSQLYNYYVDKENMSKFINGLSPDEVKELLIVMERYSRLMESSDL